MAQRILLYMPSDTEVISVSPLTYVDTLYYELWYRVQNTANWTQQITYSPLEEFPVGSPVTDTPCIVISVLADATTYEYQVRRFNSDNQASEWYSGTFTTGS